MKAKSNEEIPSTSSLAWMQTEANGPKHFVWNNVSFYIRVSNNIQVKLDSNEYIWNMLGGVDERVLWYLSGAELWGYIRQKRLETTALQYVCVCFVDRKGC